MNPGVLYPLLAVGIAGSLAAALHRRLPPDVATWVLTVITVGSALSVVWTVLTLTVGAMVQEPLVTGLTSWCAPISGGHHRVPGLVGAGAAAGLLFAVAATARTAAHEWRTLRAVRKTGDGTFQIVRSDRPFAYTLPGGRGRVVTSTAMLDSLDAAERRVLFAHEEAHLSHRHHRFRFAARLAASAVPLLRPLSSLVHLSTERWADEEAAAVVGDRRLVARAISQAALAVTESVPPLAAGLASDGVLARVEAMLSPEDQRSLGVTAMAAMVGTVTTANVAGSTVALHHLFTLALHLCRAA